MYQINDFFKSAEVDDYEDGCQLEGGTCCHLDIRMSAATLPMLIEQVRQFFGADSDCITLDACEEIGRLDVNRMEDGNGDPASSEQIELWKKREQKLWYVTYTAYVYECKAVTLTQEKV